jgi:hypothetical protein
MERKWACKGVVSALGLPVAFLGMLAILTETFSRQALYLCLFLRH